MQKDLNSLYKLSDLFRKKFPEGNNIFQMMTRLLEESGELAQAVNHMENSGNKIEKYGPASKENLAKEIRDVLRTAVDVARHYNVEEEVHKCIQEQILKLELSMNKQRN